jgi:uncharacterized protein
MRLSRKQLALIAVSVVLVAVLMLVVPSLTAPIPRPWGFVLVLGAYWAVFCIPVSLIFIRPGDRQSLVSPRRSPILWLLPIQLLGVLFGALWPHMSALNAGAIGLALVVGVVNGALEEATWRGAFVSSFRDRPIVGFIARWVLFSGWHVPLAMTAGMVFEGGAAALVGGAAGLGLVWSIVAFRTGSIAYTIVAHALTNSMAFAVMFATNGIG